MWGRAARQQIGLGFHLQSGNSGLGWETEEAHGHSLHSGDFQLVRSSAARRHRILSFCNSPSLTQLHGDRGAPGPPTLKLPPAYLITASFHYPGCTRGALLNYPPANNFRPGRKCHLFRVTLVGKGTD